MRARGVDISSVQAAVNFDVLAQGGFDFVIVKGTEGASGVDLEAPHRAMLARRAGLLVAGVYHVLTTHTPVLDQAVNALKLALQHGAPIILDFELPPPELWAPPVTGDWLVQRASDFCDRIENAKQKCVVYTYPDFARHLPYGEPLLDLAMRPFWIADYSRGERHEPTLDEQPILPEPWIDWWAWQWSGNGGTHAPGIQSVVDHDVFNGSRADLEAWLAAPAVA